MKVGPAPQIDELVGKECWYCFMEPGASEITLALGRKLPREAAHAERCPADDPRRYKGEESLWVRCSWRFEYKNAVVASWGDYLAGRKSRKDNCFGPVFGKRVTRARLTSQVGDLRVDFANGYTLRVFADVSVQGSEEFNWQLYRSNRQLRFGIGPGGVWMTEQTEQRGAEQLRTV